MFESWPFYSFILKSNLYVMSSTDFGGEFNFIFASVIAGNADLVVHDFCGLCTVSSAVRTIGKKLKMHRWQF